MKQKREREEPCHICGHYHDYEGGEQCSVCGHQLRLAEAALSASVGPSEILPYFLYVGSYDSASRSELLKARGMTHILNTVPTCQPLYRNSFEYHTVSSKPPDFQECFDFLERVQKEKDARVLIHCMTGTSRSPSVAIAFLMKLKRWRLVESYKWVKDHHQATNLNPGDLERLQKLEVELLGSSSTGYGADGTSSSGPFAAMLQSERFQWAWRDAEPAGTQQAFQPAPIKAISFVPQPQSGSFVFGERQHESAEPASSSVAMES